MATKLLPPQTRRLHISVSPSALFDGARTWSWRVEEGEFPGDTILAFGRAGSAEEAGEAAETKKRELEGN